MKILIHRGVYVPPPPDYYGLELTIRGKRIKLTPKQEEMAIAWAKKQGTVYVEDPVFVSNFMKDFSKELGIEPPLKEEEVDFGPAIEIVQAEKERKERMTKEEKKILREERKQKREALKTKYGYAIYGEVDDEIFINLEHILLVLLDLDNNSKDETDEETDDEFREIISDIVVEIVSEYIAHPRIPEFADDEMLDVNKLEGFDIFDPEVMEIANYVVEPSSIFMGRGEHPLRGSWKEGAQEEDIILNLCDEAPLPGFGWKEVHWEPDTLYVAKWTDKLTGKVKYVWLADTSPLKQEREKKKFESAMRLRTEIERVRKYIDEAMTSEDPKIRQIATACYIIDKLSMRVGDEKDPDEADTVGATTLRPEHIKIHDDGTVEFKFLGKDSVLWHKKVKFPPKVLKNLRELIANAEAPKTRKKGHPTLDNPQIFPDVTSRHVNEFLQKAMPGLTAKVFRTFNATVAVEKYLENVKISPEDPDFIKKQQAQLANLEAARICNHFKQAPKNWEKRIERHKERVKKAKERIAKAKMKVEERKMQLERLKNTLNDLQSQLKELKSSLKTYKEQKDEKKVKSYTKKIERMNKRIETAKKRIQKKKEQIERAKERVKKAELALKKIQVQFEMSKKTRTWNLGTSLKSYIDPRVFYNWFQQVDYDWKRYYPKTLVRKFAWVENEERAEVSEVSISEDIENEESEA